MNLAVVGSGALVGMKSVQEIIRKTLCQFRPKKTLLLPGHESFNALVREQAARLGLVVEEMHPPRPFWVGACPQSVRKRLARGFYARAVAKNVDLVLALKAEGKPGASFSQLLEAAKEAVVVNLKPSVEE